MTAHSGRRSPSDRKTLAAFFLLLSLKLTGVANAQIEEQTYEDYVERGNYVEAKKYLIQNANVFEELDRKFLDLASKLQQRDMWIDSSDLYLEALQFNPRNLEKEEYLDGIREGLLSCCVRGELPTTCGEWWRRFSKKADSAQKNRVEDLLTEKLEGFLEDPLSASYNQEWYLLSQEIGSSLAPRVRDKLDALQTFQNEETTMLRTDPNRLKRHLTKLKPERSSLPGHSIYLEHLSKVEFMIDYLKLREEWPRSSISIDNLLSRQAANDDIFRVEVAALQGLRQEANCRRRNRDYRTQALDLTSKRYWPELGRLIADFETDTRCKSYLDQGDADLIDYLKEWLDVRERSSDRLSKLTNYFSLASAWGDESPPGADPIGDGYLPTARNERDFQNAQKDCTELQKLSAVVLGHFRNRPSKYAKGDVQKDWNRLTWAIGEDALTCATDSCENDLFMREKRQLADLYSSEDGKKALAGLSDKYRRKCYGSEPAPSTPPTATPPQRGPVVTPPAERAHFDSAEEESPDTLLPYDCNKIDNDTMRRDVQEAFELIERSALSRRDVKKIEDISTTIRNISPLCRSELWRRFGKLRLKEGRWGHAGQNFYKVVETMEHENLTYFCERIANDTCRIQTDAPKWTQANMIVEKCKLVCAGGAKTTVQGTSDVAGADTAWLAAFFYIFSDGDLLRAEGTGLSEDDLRRVQRFVETIESLDATKYRDIKQVSDLVEEVAPLEEEKVKRNLEKLATAGMFVMQGKSPADHFRQIDDSFLSAVDRRAVMEACAEWNIEGGPCKER